MRLMCWRSASPPGRLRTYHAMCLRALPGGEALCQRINRIDDCAAQWQAVADYLSDLGAQTERLPVSTPTPTSQK